jgi:hypothetical protein
MRLPVSLSLHPIGRSPAIERVHMNTDDVRMPAEEYDPFEEFNRSAGIGVVENPYPIFALVRATSPILKEDLGDMVGLGDGMSVPGGLPDVYTAFGFDAVQTVLRDGETFSSSGYAEVMGAVMGHTILEMDEPEHHTYRALVPQAFSRKAMDTWEVESSPSRSRSWSSRDCSDCPATTCRSSTGSRSSSSASASTWTAA